MANSVMRDINGPDWPLGLITVAVPGTPVGFMSVLDSAAGDETTKSIFDPEYVPRFKAFLITPAHSLAPYVANTGAIYIVRAAAVGGSGNRADAGAIVAVIQQTFLGPYRFDLAELSLNALSPYRYFLDADTAGDGAIITGLIAG